MQVHSFALKQLNRAIIVQDFEVAHPPIFDTFEPRVVSQIFQRAQSLGRCRCLYQQLEVPIQLGILITFQFR